MKITITAECPVCGWKGKTVNGVCPECAGPLIAIKAIGEK